MMLILYLVLQSKQCLMFSMQLKKYMSSGVLPDIQDLESLSSTALYMSDRLSFLVRYEEFHRLYLAQEYKEAADHLVLLLSSRSAPKYFWMTLLTDALPLITCRPRVLQPSDIYELMQCLEEISCSHFSSDYLSGSKTSIELLRLSLVKALI